MFAVALDLALNSNTNTCKDRRQLGEHSAFKGTWVSTVYSLCQSLYPKVTCAIHQSNQERESYMFLELGEASLGPFSS